MLAGKENRGGVSDMEMGDVIEGINEEYLHCDRKKAIISLAKYCLRLMDAQERKFALAEIKKRNW